MIQVPGNWQMQGFGMPIYSSIYPFKADPPQVTSEHRVIFSYSNRNPVSLLYGIAPKLGRISGCF